MLVINGAKPETDVQYLRRFLPPGLARVAATGAAAWLAILFIMTGFDYWTR